MVRGCGGAKPLTPEELGDGEREDKAFLQFSQILLSGPTLNSSSISQQASTEDQFSSLACGNTVDPKPSILFGPHTSRGDGVMVSILTPEQRAQA